jgi:hypothetical protein
LRRQPNTVGHAGVARASSHCANIPSVDCNESDGVLVGFCHNGEPPVGRNGNAVGVVELAERAPPIHGSAHTLGTRKGRHTFGADYNLSDDIVVDVSDEREKSVG